MRSSLFGRVLAALLLLLSLAVSPAHAGLSLVPAPSGGSVSGGACPAGQVATGFSSSGVPTCSVGLVNRIPGYVSGSFYIPTNFSGTGGDGTLYNTVRCYWGVFDRALTISALNISVTTQGASGAQAVLSVYDNTGPGFRPGNLLFSSPAIDASTTGQKGPALASAVTVGPGGAWFCTNSSDNASVFWGAAPNPSGLGSTNVINVMSASTVFGISATQTFSTTPAASLASTTWSDVTLARVPLIAVTAAANAP